MTERQLHPHTRATYESPYVPAIRVQSPNPIPNLLHSLRRIVMNLLIAFTGAYGLSVSSFLLLRAAVGESLTIVAVYNTFLHLLLLPSLLLLPVFFFRTQ